MRRVRRHKDTAAANGLMIMYEPCKAKQGKFWIKGKAEPILRDLLAAELTRASEIAEWCAFRGERAPASTGSTPRAAGPHSCQPQGTAQHPSEHRTSLEVKDVAKPCEAVYQGQGRACAHPGRTQPVSGGAGRVCVPYSWYVRVAAQWRSYWFPMGLSYRPREPNMGYLGIP